MKFLFIIIGILLYAQGSFAQSGEPEDDGQKVKSEVRKQLKKEVDELYREDNGLESMFYTDTALIERCLRIRLADDFTTAGMVNAIYEAEIEYDKLLNKYYRLLWARLQLSDREVLVVSQRNWLKFRDSEQALAVLVSDDKYSGGGTIQRVILAGVNQERVKTRLCKLYGYLMQTGGED